MSDVPDADGWYDVPVIDEYSGEINVSRANRPMSSIVAQLWPFSHRELDQSSLNSSETILAVPGIACKHCLTSPASDDGYGIIAKYSRAPLQLSYRRTGSPLCRFNITHFCGPGKIRLLACEDCNENGRQCDLAGTTIAPNPPLDDNEWGGLLLGTSARGSNHDHYFDVTLPDGRSGISIHVVWFPFSNSYGHTFTHFGLHSEGLAQPAWPSGFFNFGGPTCVKRANDHDVGVAADKRAALVCWITPIASISGSNVNVSTNAIAQSVDRVEEEEVAELRRQSGDDRKRADTAQKALTDVNDELKRERATRVQLEMKSANDRNALRQLEAKLESSESALRKEKAESQELRRRSNEERSRAERAQKDHVSVKEEMTRAKESKSKLVAKMAETKKALEKALKALPSDESGSRVLEETEERVMMLPEGRRMAQESEPSSEDNQGGASGQNSGSTMKAMRQELDRAREEMAKVVKEKTRLEGRAKQVEDELVRVKRVSANRLARVEALEADAKQSRPDPDIDELQNRFDKLKRQVEAEIAKHKATQAILRQAERHLNTSQVAEETLRTDNKRLREENRVLENTGIPSHITLAKHMTTSHEVAVLRRLLKQERNVLRPLSDTGNAPTDKVDRGCKRPCRHAWERMSLKRKYKELEADRDRLRESIQEQQEVSEG